MINQADFEAVNVFMKQIEMDNEQVLRVVKDPYITEFDGPTYARLKDCDFHNGTIEVKVKSLLLEDAPDFARGFIGVVFRTNEANNEFESFYIRPTNGRADNMIRRNRCIQYFAYPDYKFERTRVECPGMYECYADMTLDEWITLKIEVRDDHARLYLRDNPHPVMLINDLKLGKNVSGGIGLWIDVGTEGFFKDLNVTKW
ncbi:MAG: hypothetical protein ACI32F_00490 [Allobaculum sp.]